MEIYEAVVDEDSVLTLYLRAADGTTSSIKLGARAQGAILQTLLGSTLDPLSPVSRRFEPVGLLRFRFGDDVGVSFLLTPQIGLHFVLDRSLAGALRELLATFDDPSTWHGGKVVN